MTVLAFLAFAAFAVADWVAVSQNRKAVEYVAKPAALAALVVYAAAGRDPSLWLIAALVLSLLGDVYLMLPADLFVAGLGAFLLGHLCYVGAFRASVLARAVWMVVILAGSFPVVRRVVASVDDARLRPGVCVYAAAIALMAGSALASGRPLAIVGGTLFWASDGLLGWNRFVRPLPRAPVMVMVTYHLGQLALAAALRSG